jgi:hypothetical protein
MTCRIFIRILTIHKVSVQFHMGILLFSQSIPRMGYIDAQNMGLLLRGIIISEDT